MLLDGGARNGAAALDGIYACRPARLFCPSWCTRLLARLRVRSLDRALADGADPAASAQLALHARRLTSPATRGSLAASLERLAVAEPDYGRRLQVLPFRAAGRANARQLGELAGRLRDPAPVYSSGVAKLRRLVGDGTGPVYADRTGEWLSYELAVARAALGG